MKAFHPIPVSLFLLAGAEAALAASTPLTVDEAVELAVHAAPQLQAQQAAIEGAQAAVISAGRLPDPALVAGVENLPSNGMDAWSLERDFMTMRKIGLMQSFPNHRKRRLEKESAQASAVVAQ